MIGMNKFKLRQQLALMVGISAIMILMLQVFYYLRFYALIKQNENIYRSNIISQVENNLITMKDDVEYAAMTISYNSATQEYLITDDPITRLNLDKIVTDIIVYAKSGNKNIESVILIDNKERIIGSINEQDLSIVRQMDIQYNVRKSRYPKSFYTNILTREKTEKPVFAYLQPISHRSLSNAEAEDAGTCIMIISVENIEKMIENISSIPNSLLLILDREDKVVAANDKEIQGGSFDIGSIKKNMKNSNEFIGSYKNRKAFFQYNDIVSMGWKMVSIIPIDDMTGDLRSIRNFGFFLGVLMMLLIVIMGLGFIRSVTRPINLMVDFMNNIGEESIKKRLKITEHNEVGYLAEDINKMLDRVEEINVKFLNTQTLLYKMELAKKQADLSALQSQINPHFLYNTLDCIAGIALENEVEEIMDICAAMAGIFRYSIKESSFVYIEDEMNCIREYLKIMSLRYPDKFITTIEFDSAVKRTKVPRMTLQPIVENAIYHGLEQKLGKGILNIRVFMADGQKICFEVEDNGKGFKKENMEKIAGFLNSDIQQDNILEAGERRGVGLLNIHRRIRLYFGNEYGIKLSSREGEGAKVAIYMPILKNDC